MDKNCEVGLGAELLEPLLCLEHVLCLGSRWFRCPVSFQEKGLKDALLGFQPRAVRAV